MHPGLSSWRLGRLRASEGENCGDDGLHLILIRPSRFARLRAERGCGPRKVRAPARWPTGSPSTSRSARRSPGHRDSIAIWTVRKGEYRRREQHMKHLRMSPVLGVVTACLAGTVPSGVWALTTPSPGQIDVELSNLLSFPNAGSAVRVRENQIEGTPALPG